MLIPQQAAATCLEPLGTKGPGNREWEARAGKGGL